MIKVLIADDHRMFRESIRKVITIDNIAEVLAEASSGVELLELLKIHKPDIILMDISMPEMNGIEATKIVVAKYPTIKVLVLSSFGDEKYYYNMLEAGAKGFVLKHSGIPELKNAIEEVAIGGSWFSSELIQKVLSNLHNKQNNNTEKLTDRELEILKLICESHNNDQIARKINISSDTVKWHRANLLSKTASVNTAGLVIYAIKNKLFEVNEAVSRN